MMKKSFLLWLLLLTTIGAFSQKIVADKLQVKTSFQLGSKLITSITDDTTGNVYSHNKLMSEQAIKLFVTNRFATFSSLPSQTGQAGKYLTTNGSTLSWATVAGGGGDWASITGKPTTLSGYGITDNVTTQGNSFNSANQLLRLNGAGALPAVDAGLATGLNASNLALGTVPDARLSSNVPLLNGNNNFRYVGTAPLLGGTFFGQKTSNYVTGGLNYNSGSHILVGTHFMDTLRFNGHNQTGYGVRISPTFVNSGAYSETDRRALVVDGNTLINGNLQLTGTLTFPGVLSASSFDATTSFRLNGTNVVNTYWSNGMLSIGFPVTGTIIQNTSNGNHILYANNASNSIAIGQGTGYPSAAPANGLGVVGSVGAGTLSPNSTLSTAGSFSTAFSSKTTTYTATASDYTIIADATSAAFSITLPTAVGINGRIYVIKKVDASGNAVTVATTSSQTIDGSTTYSLSSQYKYVMVQSNGSNWIIIGNN